MIRRQGRGTLRHGKVVDKLLIISQENIKCVAFDVGRTSDKLRQVLFKNKVAEEV